ALRARVAVVAAVRPRVARVAVLGDLVVPGLRLGGVHDPAAAPDLVHARAEAAQDVHEEGRDDERRLVAAPLRAARDAAVRVAGDLASGDSRARRARVSTGDAEA